MSSPGQKEGSKMPGSTTNGADKAQKKPNDYYVDIHELDPSRRPTAGVLKDYDIDDSRIWSNSNFPFQLPLKPNRVAGGVFVQGGGRDRMLGQTVTAPAEPKDNLPSGSGTLAASSEAEPRYQNSWPTQTPNSNPSGQSSPNRSRVDALSHLPQNPSFYQPAASQTAIGQRAPGTTSSGQAPASVNEYNRLPHNSDTGMLFPIGESQRGGNFGLRNQAPKNGQIAQLPNRPVQNAHSDTSLHSIGHPFAESQYGGYSSHSQRPSMSGQSSSFAGQGGHRGLSNVPGQHMDDGSLSGLMNSMTLDNTPAASNGISSIHGFQSSQSSFQLNPSSQPWDNGTAYTPELFNPYPGDRMGSGVGRSSPAGSLYRPQRNFSGTPQPGPDIWGSRPGSRDPRATVDPDSRGLMQSFMHQSHLQQYPSHPYGNPGFPQYGAPYDNFQQAPVSRLGYPTFPQPQPPSRGRSSGEADSSPLLAEFRALVKSGRLDRDKKWELRDLCGYMVEFAGDQHGSRFIQAKLESANSDEKTSVFEEIRSNAIPLMKDVFGNYVIQKLLEHGSQVQKRILGDKMRGQVAYLSTQMYACRVVQKALEHILVEQQAALVKELEGDIMHVMKDQNGNHVVQKIVELVPREYIGFIFDSFKGRVGELSQHTYACRVIQRALEHGTEEDKKAIMSEIHTHTPAMVTDQYGNYVSQHVIERGKPEDRTQVISHVTEHLLTLSKHKFASNVVEKCIEHGTDEERRRIAEKLTGRPNGDDSHLQAMMKDQYGNYVVQKLLRTLKDQELAALKDALKPQILALKKPGANAGKHINLLETLVLDLSTAPGSPAPGSPGLQGNGGSAVPTPNLTTEPNSPSSNPPSTKASSVGDGEHQPTNGKLAGVGLNGSAAVQVRDDSN